MWCTPAARHLSRASGTPGPGFAALGWAHYIRAQNHAITHGYGDVSLLNKIRLRVRSVLTRHDNGICENQNQNPEFHRALRLTGGRTRRQVLPFPPPLTDALDGQQTSSWVQPLEILIHCSSTTSRSIQVRESSSYRGLIIFSPVK